MLFRFHFAINASILNYIWIVAIFKILFCKTIYVHIKNDSTDIHYNNYLLRVPVFLSQHCFACRHLNVIYAWKWFIVEWSLWWRSSPSSRTHDMSCFGEFTQTTCRGENQDIPGKCWAHPCYTEKLDRCMPRWGARHTTYELDNDWTL